MEEVTSSNLVGSTSNKINRVKEDKIRRSPVYKLRRPLEVPGMRVRIGVVYRAGGRPEASQRRAQGADLVGSTSNIFIFNQSNCSDLSLRT